VGVPVRANVGGGALGGTATSIGAGAAQSCATLATDITLTGTPPKSFCWGDDTLAQFRDGGAAAKPLPALVSDSGMAWSLSGYSSDICMLSSNSLQVSCGGPNGNGQLGSGDTLAHPFGSTSFTGAAVSLAMGGYHGCAVDGTGRLFCWGYNGYGELGIGTFTNALVATQVTALTSVVEVAAGGFNTCARTSNGNVYCFGNNSNGMVGDGTNTQRPSPVLVLSGSKKIRAGDSHVCSLQSDASVMCWGANNFGQLADGTFNESTKPIPVRL